MEIRDKIVDIAGCRERAATQWHLYLPHLRSVTRVHPVTDCALRCARSRTLDESATARVQFLKRGGDPDVVERGGRCKKSSVIFGLEIGHQRSGGREGRSRLRHKQRTTPQSAGDAH